MPHAELKYSNDLQLDPTGLLAEIEQIILRHDPAAGPCKGRAYPAPHFHHSHFLLVVSLLQKPHRNAGFSTSLMADIEAAMKVHIHQGCYFSFELVYSGSLYITNEHRVPV